jgi:hypothetical protein
MDDRIGYKSQPKTSVDTPHAGRPMTPGRISVTVTTTMITTTGFGITEPAVVVFRR